MPVPNKLPKAGRVALVTGGGRGLGLAFAERLAREGAVVVAVDLDPPPELRERLLSCGAAGAVVSQADVSDAAQVNQCCDEVLTRYGRCDILVNNAGIYLRAELGGDLTLDLWRRTMSVNVESMFLFCKALTPSMISASYGRIVNVSSDTVGLVIRGFSHYMASKAAVIGFTRGIANELGPHGVTANVLAPGLTRTPGTERGFANTEAVQASAQKHAINRLGEPQDLVGAMSFLTSDDAAYVTGQTLIVNGGLLHSL